MAHFAQIDENNLVVDVIVVNNSDIDNLPFPESEPVGIAYIDTFLPGKTWKQTSYNASFRFRYAGIGCTYSAQYDAFIPPQPYPDWVFSVQDMAYIPPIPYPQDGGNYIWDEATHNWVPVAVGFTELGG